MDGFQSSDFCLQTLESIDSAALKSHGTTCLMLLRFGTLVLVNSDPSRTRQKFDSGEI